MKSFNMFHVNARKIAICHHDIRYICETDDKETMLYTSHGVYKVDETFDEVLQELNEDF